MTLSYLKKGRAGKREENKSSQEVKGVKKSKAGNQNVWIMKGRACRRRAGQAMGWRVGAGRGQGVPATCCNK